ncbi:alpha/beta hydrolase [Candidatus Thorarchaeota archaeon]|nr:MAG: alpha/beta hydrolase [Candidatus Thorarchaeota archaeon]
MSQVKSDESKYLGYDGTEMFMRTWHPEGRPRSVILALHGLGAHSGTLSFVAEYFARNGFQVYVPDLRGFGHYSGIKGHVESFDEYTKDIDTLVTRLMSHHPELKLFIYGHSLGSMFGIMYSLAHPGVVDGYILPCPSVSERLEVNPIIRGLLRLLSVLNVKKQFENGLNYDYIAANPEVVERNRTDPLRWDKVTPRFAAEGFKARENAFNSAEDITDPIIVLQTGQDKILVPEMNQDFYGRIGSEDKTWKFYENLYHEPWEDEGGEVVLEDMVEWIEARI